MSDAQERVADCHAELVLDTVECALPLGHDGPHRIGDLEWEGPSVWEQNEALRAEVARLRRALCDATHPDDCTECYREADDE